MTLQKILWLAVPRGLEPLTFGLGNLFGHFTIVHRHALPWQSC